jgi:hypothetical protein
MINRGKTMAYNKAFKRIFALMRFARLRHR